MNFLAQELNNCINKKQINELGIGLNDYHINNYITLNVPNGSPMEEYYNNYYTDYFRRNILMKEYIMEPIYTRVNDFGYTFDYKLGRYNLIKNNCTIHSQF